MTYKPNPSVSKIISPAVLIFPAGTRRKYSNDAVIVEDQFENRYLIRTIAIANEIVELKLVEQESPKMNWSGEEAIDIWEIMKTLLIIGAGGHGRVVGEVAEACGYSVAYLDDQSGNKVVGTLLELEKFKDQFDFYFVGIGNNTTRQLLLERLDKLGLEIPALIHPSAYVSPTASIGAGTVVEPKAIVNTNSTVKKGVIISVGAIVDHDVVIESYAHINAGAICKGGSHVAAGEKLEAGDVVHGFN